MLKTRLITDYINSLVGREFVQGENDCNLIACKIIDILAETDLYNSLYKKYSTKEEGLKISKELCGYSNILQPIKKHFNLVVDELNDGDLLVKAHRLKNRTYYSVVPHYSGYGLVTENGVWVTKPIYEIDYEYAYRFGGE
ncbi:TPA: hypothetical protein H1V70_000129 [Salmonella enterica]|nr:hypothetical protein [Salmonella enterica]